VLASRLTAGKLAASATGGVTRSLTPDVLDNWWVLALPPLAVLGLIGGAIWLTGVRKTAYAVIAGMTIIASLFQVHAGFRLAYLDGDVAKDTLIYNTTSPDTNKLARDLATMSNLAFGDRSMEIGYDGCTQWPLNWYLRDFPSAHRVGEVSNSVNNLPPVIIGVPADFDASCSMPMDLANYTEQTYVLRWHEPEYTVYRKFAIAPELQPQQSAWGSADNPHGLTAIAGSVIDSFMTLTTPEGQQRAFRLLFLREMPAGLNGYQFRVYIRNDMLPYYNEVRYGD
jgi:hypothetical protein